jgi:hypothetical protein
VARVYAPRWWRFALTAGTVTNVVIGGLLALTAWSACAGELSLVAGATLAVYLATACRAALAAAAVAPFVSVPRQEYGSVARINIWAWPVVSLAVWAGLLASALGRTIVWRGTTYRLDSASTTAVLSHCRAGDMITQPVAMQETADAA